MSSAPLVPAAVSFVNGVPYAAAYGDVYHSSDGAIAQSRHVFLGGNGLPERWRGQRRFVVLETGFGLGVNFLVTWNAWRSDPARCEQLHYVAIEKHPLRVEDLAQLHALWPELAERAQELRAARPPLVAGFHRLLLDGGRVVLTLVFGDIAECLPQIDAAADAFYLDGFAPSKNPDMWSPQVLTRLHRLAAPGATAATYTVAGAVVRALTQSGFVCEKVQGFGRKPQMLSARFAPRWPLPPRTAPQQRHAIVIGAGLAGCATSERLAARGWQVTLIERHAAPAQEASGNVAGIAMPLLSKDDNVSSRLLRAAYLFSLRCWQQLGGIGNAFAGAACGVLQLADDARHAHLQQQIASNYPPDFVQWLDAQGVAERTGNAHAHGGWLFPQGAWVTPSSLCAAMLAAGGERVQRRFAQQAVTFERIGEDWIARGAGGIEIARAPVVIFAGGTHANGLAQTRSLPLTAIRGQVTHVPAALMPSLPLVVCGDGYVTPPANGVCGVGASYDFDEDSQLRRSSQDENLARLHKLLPHVQLPVLELEGRVGFRCVAPDRLPLVGALPDAGAAITGTRLRDVPRVPGWHGVLGFGSRGLIWAAFAAELLACLLEGEPLPIERDLSCALDPARFALKAHRRSGASSSTH